MKTISLFMFTLVFLHPIFSQEQKSGLKILQVLNRFYVEDIDRAINIYENLLKEKTCLRFQYKEIGLELAQIGTILIIAGSEEALKPYRETKATFIVSSIDGLKKLLLENGSVIIRDIKQVPTGKNMTIRHPDGIIIEYVEFKKQMK